MISSRLRIIILKILTFLTVCALFIIKFFIGLGEGTTKILIFTLKFIRGHILAFVYLIFHITKVIASTVNKSLFATVKNLKKVIHSIIQTVSRLKNLYANFIKKAEDQFKQTGEKFRYKIEHIFLKSRRKISSQNSVIDRQVRDTSNILDLIRSHQEKTHITLNTKKTVKNVKTKYVGLTIGVICILFLIFGTGLYVFYNFYIHLPRPQDIGKVNFALTSHVYDRNGKLLFDFYKDQRRTPIKLNELPPYVAKATIAIEDKDFYTHQGVSLVSGIARAFRDTYLRNRGVQGGSTITQQLVKTALLTPERTLRRKFKEIIIALETERLYSKDKILEMYLNQVPYGGSVYGIEEASRKFFNKSAKDITLSEAALLAGLPQAPSMYSPFTNIASATARRDQVLQEMLIQNLISIDEYERAEQEQVHIATDTIPIDAPHFVFYVRKYLEKYLDTNDLYQGGYMIRTTLDLDIQKKAEEILQEEIQKVSNLNVSNGAILVTNPSTGEILAMVGSVDYFDGTSGEFNVTTALRQPGSSIKPIVYAYALQNGYTAATSIDDTPTVFQTGGSESYRPVNYDGKFHGRVTVRNALGNSYNIPAVKVMNRIGVPEFMDFAKEVGIDTWEDPSNYGLSLALGGGEVTMTDMAQAYGVLAYEGKRIELSPILTLAGKGGIFKGLDTEDAEQIVDPSYAYIISDILADNQARANAFGYNSLLEIRGYRVAVKTGTTDEKRDNWTIGYTPDYLVVVWVGNNDHTPMNPYLTSGVTGAAPIWNRMMQYLLDEKGLKQKKWYEQPTNIVQKPCMGRNEFFVAGTENSVPCALPTPRKDIAGSTNATN
jgi:1A family penicillin-binding protein